MRRSLSMFYLTQALKSQLILKPFEASSDVETTFNGITTISEFWSYSTTVLLDTLYLEDDENNNDDDDNKDDDDDNQSTIKDESKLLYENKLLGVARVRQVKVKGNTCPISKHFRHQISACYRDYVEEYEDRSPFGPGKGTAWVYNSAKKTGSISYRGHISTYGAGGYYQDFTKNKTETLKILNDLKDKLWVTRGTRAIFIDFSLYNANINLFCICKLIFEVSPTGGIRAYHSLRAVKLLYFVDTWDYATYAAELVTYIIAVYYLFEEFREMVHFKHRYFAQFWSYMDLTNIAMAFGKFATSLTIFPTAIRALEKIGQHQNEYGNLEPLGNVKRYNNNFAALLLFFTYMKLFKYLNFNKVMGQLNNTLRRCTMDIIGFLLMFFVIFFAYAQLGLIVFGHVVEDFSTFGISMFTLLRTILGDFDYEDIEKANRVMAPIFFLTYIFFVFFVLLNMFLAIINDTYADVKTEIPVNPEEMQMSDYIKNMFYNLFRKCGFKIKTVDDDQKSETVNIDQQLREILRKCGFNNLEIEMFFARYNVDPFAEIRDYDLKEILRDIEGQKSVFAKMKLDEQETNVYLVQYREQQERFNRVEDRIRNIVERADVLRKKLEELDGSQRQRT